MLSSSVLTNSAGAEVRVETSSGLSKIGCTSILSVPNSTVAPVDL